MPDVRVGVGVVVHDAADLLLVRRAQVHGHGTWSTPGGHLDFGESFADCARREAREEVGIVLDDPRFLGVTNDVIEEDAKHYVTIWMHAAAGGQRGRLDAPEEIDRIAWWRWPELPEPLFAPFRSLLASGAVQELMGPRRGAP